MVSDQELDKIILDGDPEALVKCAERIGSRLSEQGLKTHQIRSFFGAVRRIEMGWLRGPDDASRARTAQRELRLLKPRLAYQARRIRQVGDLQRVLSPAIDRVLAPPEDKHRERFTHFVEFFEAVVAYGKDED